MASQSFDAVVVGSGAGGGAGAWALAERGLRVLLLEAGPPYDPLADYRLHTARWEQVEFPAKPVRLPDPTVTGFQLLEPRFDSLRSWNHLGGRLNKTDRRQSWGYARAVGLGGSTLRFTGEAHRLHPGAMKMRTRFGVAADWPVDYAELEPYYAQAERVVGVAGPASDPARPRSAPFPLPAHRLSFASSKLAAGARRLGLRWVPNSMAALSAPYDGRPGCNYCGGCPRGCPRRDKGSTDVTFIAKAAATGRLTVRTGCQATALETGSGDRVAALIYLDEAGAARRALARAFVLACGAVETPRLLLNAAGPGSPDGLANESGQVGRHFMETLFWGSAALHPESLHSYRGLPSDSICWDFNAPDAVKGIIGGCRFSSNVHEANLAGPINYARRVVGGWGQDHHRRMREAFGRVLSVGAIGENLPSPRAFVDLDPDRKDTLGLALARIHCHLDDAEIARLAFMAKTARAILSASGAEDPFEEYGAYDSFAATHVFGTCRMGDDPRESVVDRNCRSHRWKNLFVADASVFPSSGGGEAPALTIEALAIRAGDHIASLASRREL